MRRRVLSKRDIAGGDIVSSLNEEVCVNDENLCKQSDAEAREASPEEMVL